MTDTVTPNAKLTEIEPGRGNWADTMNQNFALIDAILGAYFVIQNLQGVWQNSTVYTDGSVVDTESAVVYACLVPHTSAPIPSTFADERAAHPEYWGVYSSPARSRGVWMTHTAYALNDFVVSGSQYAICILTHTSDDDFATDLADGKWSVLVDLSTVGEAVLPVPGGAGDANKFAVVNSGGSGYTIISAVNALTILGATSIGTAVLQAASSAAALNAIGAQPAGSYQPTDAALTSLSGKTIGTFGLTLLACAAASNARSALALGTAATLDVGTAASKIVQLDGTAKLPAVDGSALTNVAGSPVATGTVQMTFDATALSGWLLLTGGTIGNAVSGGTVRANADTSSLFTYLWTNLADAQAAVSTGRGGSAAADYAANKTITLPDARGRVIAVLDGGANIINSITGNNTRGAVGGEQTHTLTNGELASHSHGGPTLPTDSAGIGGTGGNISVVRGNDALGTNITLGTTANDGGGTAHNNVQPVMFMNLKIKL